MRWLPFGSVISERIQDMEKSWNTGETVLFRVVSPKKYWFIFIRRRMYWISTLIYLDLVWWQLMPHIRHRNHENNASVTFVNWGCAMSPNIWLVMVNFLTCIMGTVNVFRSRVHTNVLPSRNVWDIPFWGPFTVDIRLIMLRHTRRLIQFAADYVPKVSETPSFGPQQDVQLHPRPKLMISEAPWHTLLRVVLCDHLALMWIHVMSYRNGGEGPRHQARIRKK